jgi:hypothetical protein
MGTEFVFSAAVAIGSADFLGMGKRGITVSSVGVGAVVSRTFS